MKLAKTLQNRLFKMPIFKGLLQDFLNSSRVTLIPLDELTELKSEIEKVGLIQQKEAYHFRTPQRINDNINPDRKPYADVPFSFLRRMAVLYPIARACINRRIRQITQLEWDITTIDELEKEEGYKEQIKMIKDFFKRPMGHKTRFSEMLALIVDDILTVDATCFEMARLRGGVFDFQRGLIPVDPTTIVLRVTETGATPEPPEVAYAQVIDGKMLGKFTTDEMLYDKMSNRSYSPYGLAPLESLILQSEAALRGTMYNLDYFRENNVPEGFITLPEDVAQSKEKVEEWQMWFDALLAGDRRMTHRLKILPAGSEYIAAKKPEDMAFERFELWLLQQTCAVFDVPPQDIGITYQVNKATSETQANLSVERGLLPLGNFIKEMLDDLIQNVMGFEALQFQFVNINPVDRKEEVEMSEKEIKMGVLSVDEYRQEHGREPIGMDHFVMGTVTRVEDILNPKEPEQVDENGKPIKQKPKEDDKNVEDIDEEKSAQVELKKWRKCIYNCIDQGKALKRDFSAEHIDEETYKAIQIGLTDVHSKAHAKLLFDEFLDPEVSAAMKLLKVTRSLRGK